MDIVSVRSNSYNLMCRLCLSTDDYLLSVFDESHTFLPQRIAACVNVEVHTNDKLPTTICKPCFTRVEDWFNFKKCCDDSQSKLRQWASINNIISNKTMNMTIQVKEDALSDSEDIQIIENEISIFKEELIDEIYLHSDTEEPVKDPFSLQPCDAQSSSAYELTDSLLVPTYECPATVHGLNGPPKNSDNRGIQPPISSLTKECSVCYKEFSSAHNRIRHERNVHNVNNVPTLDETLVDSPLNLEPEIVNVQSINSEDSNSNNNVGESNDVTVQQFAASLQLVQSNPAVSSTPMSERHFIEYHAMISQMLINLCCCFCGLRYRKHKSMLAHLTRVLKLEKFTCFTCCIAFPNRSQYMKHMFKKFCKQRARLIKDSNCPFKAYQHYKCTICKELFVHKMHLTSHLLVCHLQPNHTPSCERCEHLFQDYNEYKEHLQGSCFYKLYCSICKNSYSPEEFTEHCKIHEENNSEFNFFDYINKDYDCRTKIPTVSVKPIKENNTNVNKYSCGRCGEQFPTLDMWCEHQQVHSDNNIHRCTECNRVFATEIELEQHKNTHVNNNIKLKLYRCSDTNSYKAVSDFSSSNSPQLEQSVDDVSEKEEQLQISGKTEEKKSFRCSVCKKYYASAKGLRAHKRLHSNIDYRSYRKRRFPCPNCKKNFGSRVTLGTHKNECFRNKENSTDVVNIKKEYSEVNVTGGHGCQVCNKSFPTEKGLIIHSKLHTSRENDAEKLACQLCNKKFLNIETLLDHMKSHSTKSVKNIFKTEKTEQKPMWECKICNKMCITNSGLSSHMKKHLKQTSPQVNIKDEPESKAFKCNFCSMEYENRSALTSHIKIHLNGANIAYNCTICQKVCSNSYQLTAHVRFKHSDDPKNVKIKQEFPVNKCFICKKKFTTEALLQTHLKTHAKVKGNKKFKCTSCLKTLSTASSLRRHLKGTSCLHCAKCNKNFTSAQAHSSHKGWHARQHNNSVFNCNQCNAEFDFQKDYVKHLKTHKKPYQCKFCPKAFHYMKSLLTHSTYSHGDDGSKPKTAVKNPLSFKIKREVKTEIKQERPANMYRCTECNTTFVNSKQLRLHVLGTHMAADM